MIIDGRQLRKGDTVVESEGKPRFVIPGRVVDQGDEAVDLWLEKELSKGSIPDVYGGGTKWSFRHVDYVDETGYEGTIYEIL